MPSLFPRLTLAALVLAGSGAAAQTPSPRAPALTDTHWVLTRLGDQDVPATANHDPAELVLQAEGSRVAGTTGCNRIMGPYKRDGRMLTIGPLATTRMACPDLADRESEFLRRLAAVRTWRIRRGKLALYDEGGAVLARFRAAPAAAPSP